MKRFIIIVALFAIISFVNAFYLPGVAPREYKPGELVPLKVNKLTSIDTQVPYAYYDLPFCRPKKVKDAVENLGEILLGDRIESSDYLIEAKVPIDCRVYCKHKYGVKDIFLFKKRIVQQYKAHWIIDNLPGATKETQLSGDDETVVYNDGFFIGSVEKGESGKVEKVFLNNHIHINLLYHQEEGTNKIRIVGFEVAPQSVEHDTKFISGELPSTCPVKSDAKPLEIGDSGKEIVWTYSVTWEKSDIRWALRWDVYLKMQDNQIHWFSIINSLMIVLFLSGMVAMIVLRTVNADFKRYRELESKEEAQEETGWKLVHGDVFRPPKYGMFLSVFIGTGLQVVAMAFITLMFSVLGFLSPTNRGSLLTALIVFYVFLGAVNGYYSARFYKLFGGTMWKENTILTAFLFPGTTFAIFFFINFFLLGKHSSGAVHFVTLVTLAMIWFGVSVPLVFFGSYFGERKQKIEVPVRTNQIPRQVPDQPWYMNSLISILMGGILPFGAVFIEVFFIMASIWLHQFYYLFGFLFIVVIILIITCAEIAIVMCYFQLCSEDYHWWWRAYLTAGSSAFYVFGCCVFYFFNRLHIKTFVSTLLYFGYSVIFSLFFFVLTGSVGFLACFWFIKMIYANVKVD